jgi:hypothetical protein
MAVQTSHGKRHWPVRSRCRDEPSTTIRYLIALSMWWRSGNTKHRKCSLAAANRRSWAMAGRWEFQSSGSRTACQAGESTRRSRRSPPEATRSTRRPRPARPTSSPCRRSATSAAAPCDGLVTHIGMGGCTGHPESIRKQTGTSHLGVHDLLPNKLMERCWIRADRLCQLGVKEDPIQRAKYSPLR